MGLHGLREFSRYLEVLSWCGGSGFLTDPIPRERKREKLMSDHRSPS